jgi:hypothetical protein
MMAEMRLRGKKVRVRDLTEPRGGDGGAPFY